VPGVQLELPTLSDGVVQLRPFVERDATTLVEIWRDAEIRKRNTVPEPTEAAARRWIQRSHSRADAGEAWEWAIVDAETQELAGRRALKDIDWGQRRAVAGSWVARRSRGKQFAARSLRLAAAHAFAHGILRIHAECDTDNEPSVRSLLSAGMRHEGTLRAHYVSDDGQVSDHHVFGMLAGDPAEAPPLRTP
jgi:RimJ/RimL family protein N-acetyltransferase